jgi:hypothetical protein
MNSKNAEMVNKAVSFNVLDPDQLVLLEHAVKRKNFSAYVKRLIQRDIDNAFAPKVIQVQGEQPQPEEVSFEDGLMDNLI